MADPPLAFLCHRCDKRARLKIAARRNDGGYFQQLSARLAEAPGVIGVKANALTASVLIVHQGRLDDIIAYAAEKQLFAVSADPVFAHSHFAEPDEISLKGFATVALFGLGVVQLLRGYALGPASGLFALAWHLSRGRAAEEPPVGDGTG